MPVSRPRKRQLKRTTRRLRPAIGSLAIRSVGRLSIPAARRLGRLIGRITYKVGGRSVDVSRQNLQRCFPELTPDQREALVRESLIHTAMTATEAPVIWAQPFSRLERYLVSVEGFELIEEQQASGRGLLLLAPHLGNWEFMGPVIPRRLAAVSFMYQPTGMEAVDKLMIEGRSKDGIKLAPANRQGVSRVLKALQAGEVVSILPDQVPDAGGGELAPFFGHNALTMTLVYKLVQRTKCDVLMIYAKRVPEGFRLVVREAQPGLKADDMAESLDALNRSVETCVREAPEQYQWEYKRFKGAD
ncbi:lysophospholipid acyltransferase family protein [Gilvimarinus sp. F26214L]|uniref:lysophospholipid acyltransferase family protein n=1 Tax=Gilvimarinus sp. DZF01 TaxID=3461371 RepID=UPI0040464669